MLVTVPDALLSNPIRIPRETAVQQLLLLSRSSLHLSRSKKVSAITITGWGLLRTFKSRSSCCFRDNEAFPSFLQGKQISWRANDEWKRGNRYLLWCSKICMVVGAIRGIGFAPVLGVTFVDAFDFAAQFRIELKRKWMHGWKCHVWVNNWLLNLMKLFRLYMDERGSRWDLVDVCGE